MAIVDFKVYGGADLSGQIAQAGRVHIPSAAELNTLFDELVKLVAIARVNDKQELDGAIDSLQTAFGRGRFNHDATWSRIQDLCDRVDRHVGYARELLGQVIGLADSAKDFVTRIGPSWLANRDDLVAVQNELAAMQLYGWQGSAGDAYRDSLRARSVEVAKQIELSDQTGRAAMAVALLQIGILTQVKDTLWTSIDKGRYKAQIEQRSFAKGWWIDANKDEFEYEFYGRTAAMADEVLQVFEALTDSVEGRPWLQGSEHIAGQLQIAVGNLHTATSSEVGNFADKLESATKRFDAQSCAPEVSTDTERLVRERPLRARR